MAITVLTPFTTTTVITQPTAPTFPSDFSHQPIPIAAIVGGIIGGASLAVLVTAGWICWGRFLKRKQTKERLEIESQLQTLRNTQRNATIFQPSRNSSDLHWPMSARIPEPKIRFANYEDMKFTKSIPTRDKDLPESSQSSPGLMQLRRLKPPSKQSNSYQGHITPAGRRRATSLPVTVANKSSAPSLASSTYMTASGEEDSTTLDQLGNGVGPPFPRFLTKKSWQASGAASFEAQRQSVSTYETATSRFIDDDI